MPTRSLLRAAPREQGVSLRGLSSRHFLKLIEDTGEVGFWSADLSGERFEASVGLSRILGLDPTVVVTFDMWLDMIHPEDQAAHGDQIEVLRSGQPIAREFRVIRPDRTLRWLLHRAEVILGPDGQPSHGMGVVFDVTLRHDTLKSIRQHHDRMNALIKASMAAFWVIKPNGAPSEMLQWMALTGQTRAETEGHGWLNAIHPDDRARTQAAWAAAVAETTPYNADYRICCADGVYRWFNARGAPVLNKDGSVREWVGVCLGVPGRGRLGSGASSPSPVVSASPDEASMQLLTPAQIRAARGMACLSKEELARRANVSVSTIVRLEDGESPVRPRADTLLAVRRALEESGIEFLFDASGKPGLREV